MSVRKHSGSSSFAQVLGRGLCPAASTQAKTALPLGARPYAAHWVNADSHVIFSQI